MFDLEEENRIFETEGVEACRLLQREREEVILNPGPAFGLIASLLRFNEARQNAPPVEVVVMSRNRPDVAIRLFRSAAGHQLAIKRGAFTGGRPLAPRLAAFGVDLFLSRGEDDVQDAINAGFPAAVLYDPPAGRTANRDEVHIAFDGDAVLFSPESEMIYKAEGLAAFLQHETDLAAVPVAAGPFAKVLRSLADLQKMPGAPLAVRVSVVTARHAPAHERVLRTLRDWNIDVDEAYFLGGITKAGCRICRLGARAVEDRSRMTGWGWESSFLPSERAML